MIDPIIAIDVFICEANNFESVSYTNKFTGVTQMVPRFIVEAKWTCNIEHMISKWHEACRCTDCYGFFNMFYCEMDTPNKEAMVKWILSNRERGYIRS